MVYRRNLLHGANYLNYLVTYQDPPLGTESSVNRLLLIRKRKIADGALNLSVTKGRNTHQPEHHVPSSPSKHKQQGLTLLEIAIVVSLLAIMSAVTLPNLANTDTYRLGYATAAVMESIRFARAEAIRTGTPHGINISTVTNAIKVYSLPSIMPVYDVYHPVDKALYTIQLNTTEKFSGVTVNNASFSFDGPFISSSYLGFNSHGMPKYSTVIPAADYMLTSGTITLNYHNEQRIIAISPMTGRVTVQ